MGQALHVQGVGKSIHMSETRAVVLNISSWRVKNGFVLWSVIIDT